MKHLKWAHTLSREELGAKSFRKLQGGSST